MTTQIIDNYFAKAFNVIEKTQKTIEEMADFTSLSERPQKETVESVTKRVYELKLHEYMFDQNGLEIKRVPGGWIYNKTVFVPYHNEGMNDNLNLL